MKHEENVTFEFIPANDPDDQAWNIRILEGMFNETVIQYGAISLDGTGADKYMSFNFEVIESPDEELNPDNVDLQETAGDILQELLRAAIERDDGTIGLREVNEGKPRTDDTSEYSD